MDDNDKEFVIKAFKVLQEPLIKQLNKNFQHMTNRFDDVEKRLESIENRLNIMDRDTDTIPRILVVKRWQGHPKSWK